MTYPPNNGPRNSNSYMMKSIFQIAWKVVVGIGVIVGIITGIVGLSSNNSNSYNSASSSPASPTAAASTSPTAAASIEPTGHPTLSPTPTPPQPNPEPTIPSIPILRPIINQPGWTLAWHQRVPIGPQGVVLGSSGPQASDGNGDDYDLQYVPGSDNGWGYGGYVDAFNSWSHNYAPGPATINGISGTSTGSDVTGTEAHVGDRLYVTRAYAFQVDRIAYMQIVRVGRGSVVADIWVWNAS